VTSGLLNTVRATVVEASSFMKVNSPGTWALVVVTILAVGLLGPAVPAAKRKPTKIQSANTLAHAEAPFVSMAATNPPVKP
jgi:hypothetical protein